MPNRWIKPSPDVVPGDNNWGQQHVVDLQAIPEDVLYPIVCAMAGRPVRSWRICHEITPRGTKGFYGYKLLPSFYWTAQAGAQGKTIACIKAGPPEAIHYRGLAEAGFPVCRLYGDIAQPDGLEIVFLEYLVDFIHNPADENARNQLIELRARLNATRPGPAYDAYLKASLRQRADAIGDGKQRLDVRAIWENVWNHAAEGKLGTEARQLSQNTRSCIDAIAELAQTVRQRVAQMPLALTNPELNPGRRPETGETACVDLHVTAIRPRFTDVLHCLGKPEDVRDGWGDAWSPRELWAQRYAQAYSQAGGEPISAREVLDEAYTLWLAHALDQRWWTDRCLAGETGCCQDLTSVMRHLIKLVSK